MILEHDVWVDRTLTTLAAPHSEGSFLLARKGGFMHDDRAKALGIPLRTGHVADSTPKDDAVAVASTKDSKPAVKQMRKFRSRAFKGSENKMMYPTEDKDFGNGDDYSRGEDDSGIKIEIERIDDLD